MPAKSVQPETPQADSPYLLLDVRDRDAYDACHIIGGKIVFLSVVRSL